MRDIFVNLRVDVMQNLKYVGKEISFEADLYFNKSLN